MMFDSSEFNARDWSDARITKAQRKDLARVFAWFQGKPFRESSRQKAQDMRVPTLMVEDVLAQYVPPCVRDSGQFFTPLDMSQALYDRLRAIGVFPLTEGTRVLDPCAGIGHLFYHLPAFMQDGVTVDAYEIERECVAFGERLFPSVSWEWEIPFEKLPDIEGRYDCVLMNPPFGDVRRGMHDAIKTNVVGARRAEHLFLELAIRALKPDGVAVVLAPYNLLERLPRLMTRWFEENAWVEDTWGPLPGDFSLTKVRVHAFVLRRLATPVLPPLPIVPPPPMTAMRQLTLFDF